MDGDTGAGRDALTALDEAFARGDVAGALRLCTDYVLFIGSGDGEEAVGRDAIGPMFKALAPQLEDVTFQLGWESVDVDVIADVAL